MFNGKFLVTNTSHSYYNQTVKIYDEVFTYKDNRPHYAVFVASAETVNRFWAELSDLLCVNNASYNYTYLTSSPNIFPK